jgi:predicted nucleic acid-binding protein
VRVQKPLMVDASVALKWPLPGKDSERTLGLTGRSVPAAPELMLVEAASALWTLVKRRQLTPVEARASLSDLQTVPIEYVADRQSTPAALSLAADLGYPVHDCLSPRPRAQPCRVRGHRGSMLCRGGRRASLPRRQGAPLGGPGVTERP